MDASEADQILSILDCTNPVPDDLIEKVLLKKHEINQEFDKKIDFSKYLQIAVVFIAAILIGVLMGKNAKPASFAHKRKLTEQQFLIELNEKYHFSSTNAFGKF